jgi:hypothetical protein
VEELKSFKDKWTMVHRNHPSTMPGSSIVDALLTKPNLQQRYVKPHTYKFKSNPTSMHILEDISDTDTFYHGITMQHAKNVTFKDFLYGWLNMGDSGDPLEAPPYVAVDVQRESPRGLHKCMDGLPMTLQSDDVMVCRAEDGTSYSFKDVIAPALTISRPRVNGYGIGQVFLVPYGVQLVLWWDDSPEVRKIFGELDGSEKVDYTWNAVKSWPGLKWSILHVGEYIPVLPGTIHAVLSPVNSAMCSWSYMEKNWMKSGILRDMLTWELELVEKRIKINEATENPDVVLDNIETEMKHLQVWIQRGELEKDLKKEVQKLKIEIEKRVKSLKKVDKPSKRGGNI